MDNALKRHVYDSPDAAWRHAQDLHRRGLISATDLKHVHRSLSENGHEHHQQGDRHRMPQSLADLGKR